MKLKILLLTLLISLGLAISYPTQANKILQDMQKKALDGDPKAIKAVENLRSFLDKEIEDNPEYWANIKKKRLKQNRDAVIALKSGDYETAFKIWLPFAERGSSAIQWNIGTLYHLGKGVDKDIDKALYWYKESAELGYHAGQHSLGQMYQDGTGVTQDFDKAVYWYEKAAKQGNKQALQDIDKLMSLYDKSIEQGKDPRQELDEYNLNYEK